jgi:AGZA family xanthine/uracil permease-like MFS transporter
VSGLLERLFEVRAHGTTVQREVTAGVVTFLTMAYIIAVNPLILDAALKRSGVPITATGAGTCLAAAIPTLAMGLWANFPLALAPGMGLNAFLTYTLILGMGIRWQTAMGIVFVEGVIIALLVLVGLREALMRAIPSALKTAIGSGIGLFIAFIGLQNAGWVVKSDATMVAAGSFHAAGAIVSAAGVLVTAALMMRRVKGALLLGVIATTLFAGIATKFGTKMLTAPATIVAIPDLSTFGKLDIMGALSLKFAAIIFAFMMSDFFDTMGTVVAVARAAHLEDTKGNIPRLGRILMVDSLAASWGGLCSASSSTSYSSPARASRRAGAPA